MKIFFALAGLSFLGIGFLSCSKDSKTVSTATKTDNLVASAWVYENSGVDNDRNGTIDVPLSTIAPTLIQPCKIDNPLTFKKDNTGSTDEGATKCTATDPQTSSFIWNFADNEASINISNSIFSLVNGKSKIVTLNSTSLVLTRDTVIAANTFALVVTLKH